MEKVEYLKKFSFFSKIPKKFLMALLHFIEIEEYQKDNIIYSENDIANKFYMIREGEIEITNLVEIDN